MKRKQKGKTVNKMLRLIAVLMLLVFAHIVLNFEALCYASNSDVYELSVANVSKKTTDLYLLLVPMVELEYTYEGQVYNERKLFVLEKTFGLSGEEGTTLEIYINKTAPNYPIFKINVFKNIYNYIFLLFEVICVILIFRRTRRKKENDEDEEGEETSDEKIEKIENKEKEKTDTEKQKTKKSKETKKPKEPKKAEQKKVEEPKKIVESAKEEVNNKEWRIENKKIDEVELGLEEKIKEISEEASKGGYKVESDF